MNIVNKNGKATNNFATKGFAITPNDSADLSTPAYGLIAQVAGNVAVDFLDEGTNIVVGIEAGQVLPITVSKVYATNTTATGIVGLN